MFLSLLKIECRQILRSLVYYIYVIIFVLFMTSQMSDADWTESLQKPVEGRNDYGTILTDDPNIIMRTALDCLSMEVKQNQFVTYPLGFYKEVVLNEEELEQVWSYLLQCANETREEIENGAFVTPKEELTYEQFSKKMEQVTKVVGKGSQYEQSYMKRAAAVPMTYEDAIEDYNKICMVDRVTGTYLRLFCDYAGILLAILPIFLGVTRCLRDRRTQAEEVIFSKKISSPVLMLARYLANVIMVFLPVVITAFLVQLPYQYRAETMGVTPDYFAFLTYTIIWLLPEIMVVLAISFLITEMTGNSFAILIQVFWGIGSLFSAQTLVGDFGFHLVIRWNTIGQTGNYLLQKSQLYWNRGIYALMAAVAMALAVLIYQKKRKEGTTLYGKLVKNRR